MANRRHPSGLPSSPWAQAYYPSLDPFWYTRGDGLAHSGLAPEYPHLNRDDLGDGRIPPRTVPVPGPEHLDRLFYGERQQKDLQGGVMTWQIGALREGFYSFEQASQYDRRLADAITIDESKWLPCFRKDRWLDHPSSVTRHIRNPITGLLAHSNHRTTIDNPIVWGEIRFCIELANRILIQLVRTRDSILDAILFADRVDWASVNPDIAASALNEPGHPPRIAFQRQPHHVASTQRMWNKLKEMSRDVLWGFMDDDNQHQNICVLGLTVYLHAAQVFQTDPPNLFNHGGVQPQTGALLHVALLRPLLEADTPLVERSATRVQIAYVMVHELMHCLGIAKEPYEPSEPFIEPFAERELGRVIEMAVFGQMLQFHPQLYSLGSTGVVGTGSTTVVTAVKWPFRKNLGKLPPKLLPPWEPEDECEYAVPSEWTTALQSQPYWLDVVSRWGTRALRPPHVFRSNCEMPDWYIGDRRHGAIPIKIRHVPDDMKDLYLNAVRRWKRQHAVQRSNRPWWEFESKKWQRSPWSWIQAREAISKFREAHQKRDMVRCLQSINALWCHNGGNQEVWRHPTTWLYRCICHLMMASIPNPQGNFNRKGRPLRISGIPSREAALRLNYRGELLPTAQFQNVSEDVIVGSWPFVPIASTALSDFYALFAATARKSAQPYIWLETCMKAFRDLCRDSVQNPNLHAWLPFNFDVPPYDGNNQWAHIQKESQGFAYEGRVFPQIVYGTMPAPISDVDRFVSPPSSPPSADQLLPHTSTLPVYRTKHNAWGGAPASQPNYPRYFTVGTVGNHMYGDSFWVVESDGAHGYDIFRITKKCKELGYHTADDIRRELVTVGPLGPSLLTEGHPHAEEIRREFRSSLHPIGKLLIRQKLEVIAEHNGQHGMPLWVIIGSDVYDITEFPFASREEEEQLRSTPGGVPETLKVSGDSHPNLLERLLPFKCALVDGTRGLKKQVLEPYTPLMLRWHDNPTAGMYTAINGIVYDITGYYESHPGGTDILIGDLGRESTGFFKHHDTELMDHYEDLALGRLVPQITASELGKDQVAIHGWVYDLSGLNRDEHWFLEAIQPLGGQDASEALSGSNMTATALLHLLEHEKGHVVGGIASSEAVKAIPDGELAKHNDPRRVQGGWVAVEGRVYDLTAVMVHGAKFYGRDVPWFWAGHEVTDERLRDWIRDNFQHCVAGRLVQGEAWPAGSGGPGNANTARPEEAGGEKRKRFQFQEGPGDVEEGRRTRCRLV